MKRRIMAILIAGIMFVRGGFPASAEMIDSNEMPNLDYEALTEEMDETVSDEYAASDDWMCEVEEADTGEDSSIEQEAIVNEDIPDIETQVVESSDLEQTEGLQIDGIDDVSLDGIEVVEDPEIEMDAEPEDLYSMGIAGQPVWISSTEIALYALDDAYQEKLEIPAGFQKEYKLEAPGASFAVTEGCSVTVSSDGWIRPATEVTYWNGNMGSSWSTGAAGETKTVDHIFGKSVITVRMGSQSYEVTVTVYDYAKAYAEKVMDDYIAQKISDGMSDMEKLRMITAFPAQYDYSASYSSYTGMIVFGGGDCWASTDAILYMCRKVGLQARSRNAANDPGAGSGHRNVSVSVDGKTYIADAGYDGTAPRPYSVVETAPFLYDVNEDGLTVTVSRYEGADYNVVILDKISGSKIRGYLQCSRWSIGDR